MAGVCNRDGDGQNNRLEYLATTSPTDFVSRLRVEIEPIPGNSEWWRIAFTPYSDKRIYTLRYTQDLSDSVV